MRCCCPEYPRHGQSSVCSASRRLARRQLLHVASSDSRWLVAPSETTREQKTSWLAQTLTRATMVPPPLPPSRPKQKIGRRERVDGRLWRPGKHLRPNCSRNGAREDTTCPETTTQVCPPNAAGGGADRERRRPWATCVRARWCDGGLKMPECDDGTAPPADRLWTEGQDRTAAARCKRAAGSRLAVCEAPLESRLSILAWEGGGRAEKEGGRAGVVGEHVAACGRVRLVLRITVPDGGGPPALERTRLLLGARSTLPRCCCCCAAPPSRLQPFPSMPTLVEEVGDGGREKEP